MKFWTSSLARAPIRPVARMKAIPVQRRRLRRKRRGFIRIASVAIVNDGGSGLEKSQVNQVSVV